LLGWERKMGMGREGLLRRVLEKGLGV